MKLLKVDTLVQARERLLKAAKECLPETEQVALADASDRILAEDIVSGEMIPAFRRSSVDGYAVCSKDTAGATESIPVFLKVLEEARIVYDNRMTRIPTARLNEEMLPLIEAYPPPATKGKYIKIKYVTQLPAGSIPSFVFFCNLPQWVKDPYKRFLENKIRDNWDFTGTPINIFIREK